MEENTENRSLLKETAETFLSAKAELEQSEVLAKQLKVFSDRVEAILQDLERIRVAPPEFRLYMLIFGKRGRKSVIKKLKRFAKHGPFKGMKIFYLFNPDRSGTRRNLKHHAFLTRAALKSYPYRDFRRKSLLRLANPKVRSYLLHHILRRPGWKAV